MIVHSFCQRTDSIARLLLILLVATLAAVAAASTDEEFIPPSSAHLLAMKKYYDIENLGDAAVALRQDAARFDLDISEHQPAGKASPPYSVMHLPITQIRPDFSDTSYLSALANKRPLPGEASRFVAVLAVDRDLSIDEVASLFESGIRILEKLFAGPKKEVFGGYIVRGPAAELAGLRDRDYFSWLGEYRADLKWQADLGPSSLDRYSTTLYKRQIKDSYLADLEALKATVTHRSEQVRRIGIDCSWETVQQLMKLDWVRSIYPLEPDVENTVTQ